MITTGKYFALTAPLHPSQDIIGLPLKAPLTSYDTVYTLPMLTIKFDKGQRSINYS